MRALSMAATLCLASAALALAADEDAQPDTEASAATNAPDDADRDPWEPMNRGIFWFNDRLDVYVLEPTARGWNWAVPQPVQTGVSNFFANLRFPIVFVNEAFQAKPVDALRTFARFGINSTLGIAGFLDPASEFGLEATDEDFGQTLGRWGVPSGPYLVLPFLGPSNVRDTGGLAVDTATSILPFYVDWFITFGPRLIDVVNTRARFLEEITSAKSAALDYYVFVRNAYGQRRRALIDDREGDEEHPYDDEFYNVVEP